MGRKRKNFFSLSSGFEIPSSTEMESELEICSVFGKKDVASFSDPEFNSATRS